MRLTLFNGSPRGKAGNTAILLKHFITGFMAAKDNSYEVMYLTQVKDHPAFAEKFRKAQAAIIAFPLYADSMPAIVKDFIETLGPAVAKRSDGKKNTATLPALGFIVQSGFPEAVHSRYVEKYCEKLARRLGTKYLGTVIKGGVEGIQVKPPFLNRRLFVAFRSLGRHFGVTKEFHPIIMKNLAGMERMSAMTRLMFRIFMATGLADMYWNMMLKKHGAYERRFDRPYEPEDR
jgi:hypothetical protein